MCLVILFLSDQIKLRHVKYCIVEILLYHVPLVLKILLSIPNKNSTYLQPILRDNKNSHSITYQQNYM